jgi:Flp pilus assembly protein protease CpaA
MSDTATLNLMTFLAVALLLFWTCWHDIATRTLPDGIAIAIAVLGLASQGISGDLAWSLAAAALVFLGAALIWYLGALGGGDVKLLAACALLPSPSAVPVLLVMTAFAGGLLALAYLAARRFAPVMARRPRRLPARIWRAETWRMRRGGPLPYALPISFGTLFAMIERV